MTVQEFDFVDVEEKAKALGCNIPTGIALLPRNFESAESKDDLLHESTVPTVRILFRNNGITETPLEHEDERFPQVSEKAFEGWVGPTLFVSFALLSQNPHIISVALGMISNYLTDWFKGIPGGGNAKLDIVVETRKKTYKRIYYEGPVSGLEKAAQVIREVSLNE
ncbi:hypothetical protein KAU37_02540 [Candidatus Bipolaricaulota bacterium]|nr:hypothetical protein [Candidatus Bipolaricaulota bacterium]